MADADLAARFFDEHKAPGLRREGFTDDTIESLRARYVADARANPEAVRQLRELYPTEEGGRG